MNAADRDVDEGTPAKPGPEPEQKGLLTLASQSKSPRGEKVTEAMRSAH